MHSPNDAGSPDSSSSSTPPPDDTQIIVDDTESFGPSKTGPSDFPGPSKRRLPGGGSFASSSNLRDAKSRRKEDTGAIRRGPSNQSWEGRDGGRSKSDKDELLDVQLVEQLRQRELQLCCPALWADS